MYSYFSLSYWYDKHINLLKAARIGEQPEPVPPRRLACHSSRRCCQPFDRRVGAFSAGAVARSVCRRLDRFVRAVRLNSLLVAAVCRPCRRESSRPLIAAPFRLCASVSVTCESADPLAACVYRRSEGIIPASLSSLFTSAFCFRGLRSRALIVLRNRIQTGVLIQMGTSFSSSFYIEKISLIIVHDH